MDNAIAFNPGALTCGANPGSPITDAYTAPFITGTIHTVTIDVSRDLITDPEAEMRIRMARRVAGGTAMLIALLAILGVDLIVIVIVAAAVIGRKRWLKKQPGYFAGAIRVSDGHVDGLSSKWNRGDGLGGPEDVLVWSKAPFLYHDEVLAVDRVSAERHSACRRGEAPGRHPGRRRARGRRSRNRGRGQASSNATSSRDPFAGARTRTRAATTTAPI